MGTLSKALGSYGGYLCASRRVIDLIKTRARTLIYSTGLPPASVAAAIAALDIIESDPRLTPRCRSQRREPSPAAATCRARKPDRAGSCSATPWRRSTPRACSNEKDFSSSRSARRPFRRARRGCASPSRARPSRRGNRTPRRHVRCANRDARHERVFRHRDRHRYRQDFVTAGLIRALASGKAESPRAQAGHERLDDSHSCAESDAGIAAGCAGRSRSRRIRRADFALALCGAVVARHGGRARRPQRSISTRLVAFCRKAIAVARASLLIEGVGGVMAPLDGRHTVLDWMAALDLPVFWWRAAISARSATR